ncbi:unnamed protein product [Menidia menidia]|uniref:(Atlantic silverside) hypothetical protein n=1 Tax=Menidia menidia TaxID=238744 RepID=A0A8S4BFU4_9TELE|nr:unnamed protein product [Menidia menidia]
MMEFPEDFNQLELLDTHGHLIPRGVGSQWTGSREEEEEVDEGSHSEEWYLEKEDALKDRPMELILWAAENNRLATLLALLRSDPSLVRCRDEDGYTPLHRAAYGGHLQAACALLAAGSPVDPRTADGWTPLHSACRWSHAGVASFLLQRGARLNAQTNGGLTPLHLAASCGGPARPAAAAAQTLELLLSRRQLRPGLRSGGGETAGEGARRSGPHHFLFEMVEDCVSVVPAQQDSCWK